MTTMISYHNDLTVFVTRPISAMFLALAAATVVVALIRNRLETRAYREAALLAQD
jgi:TctA family transporter